MIFALCTLQTPIDEIDAAARILDPILCDLIDAETGKRMHGMFFKDYKLSSW